MTDVRFRNVRRICHGCPSAWSALAIVDGGEPVEIGIRYRSWSLTVEGLGEEIECERPDGLRSDGVANWGEVREEVRRGIELEIDRRRSQDFSC